MPIGMSTSSKTAGAALPWSARLAYGSGHILNDVAATLGFCYTLLFLEKVLQLGSIYSGMVFLSGQIADGLATIAMGYFSDKDMNYWLCIRCVLRNTVNTSTLSVLVNLNLPL